MNARLSKIAILVKATMVSIKYPTEDTESFGGWSRCTTVRLYTQQIRAESITDRIREMINSLYMEG